MIFIRNLSAIHIIQLHQKYQLINPGFLQAYAQVIVSWINYKLVVSFDYNVIY